MPTESITLLLPLPNKCLSPNARTCWQAKAGATKKARRLAKECVEACELDNGSLPWPAAEATEVFFHATKRGRDERNQVAMLKAYYDGIVDAGLISDDNFEVLTHGKPSFKHDKENPRVEITLTRTK